MAFDEETNDTRTLNLNTAPYFDDFDADSNYHKVLFKPATAVQVRELNQLQTILQNQISQFGDHILKRGVLLDGCQPSFFTNVPFVKIGDLTVGGADINMDWLQGLHVRNTLGVVALIKQAVNGFVGSDPDLKTLYLEYLNSGNDKNTSSFAPRDVLTVFSPTNRLYHIRVNNSSDGINIGDKIALLSALEITKPSGDSGAALFNISVGDILEQDDGKRVEVTEVPFDNELRDVTVLRVKPVQADLTLADTENWNLDINKEINVYNSSAVIVDTIVISSKIGYGATGQLRLGINGSVARVDLMSPGEDYYIPPYVAVVSPGVTNEVKLAGFSATAENFLARVQIPSIEDEGISSPTIGFGYMMSVTGGAIYQKGHFVRVEPQSTIVSKYSNRPSDIAVGFETLESIVTATTDETLFDNAGGFTNFNAPGADRLKLQPVLVAKTFEQGDEDPEFFPIFKFSEGRPYSQTSSAVYNKLGDELARRTYENSGNFVLNDFDITTRSTIDFADSSESFSYIIDPGHAYINGHRVKTDRNYAKNVSKGLATKTINTSTDITYGNFIRVNNLYGSFDFRRAQVVDLFSSQVDPITNYGTSFVPPATTKIGTARIRSVVIESGEAGSLDAVYRIYLFNVQLNPNQSLNRLKMIGVDDGTVAASARVLPISASRQSALLQRSDINTLLFKHGRPTAPNGIINVSYRFKTIRTGTVNLDGTLSIAKDDVSTSWPYSGELSFREKMDLIVVPETNLVSSTTTTDWASFKVGDFIFHSATVRMINRIDNDGVFVSGLVDKITTAVTPVYPANIPIPLSTATVTENGSNLSFNFNRTFVATAVVKATCVLQYSGSSENKFARRNRVVKIRTTPATLNGPWCLGLPDVFRLRSVTLSGNDVTDDFYVDTNQMENFYGLAYLYQKKSSVLQLQNDNVLEIRVDMFEENFGGIQTFSSYNIDDTRPLGELTTNVHTMEVPEAHTRNGFVDLREVIDFRPKVVSTAVKTEDPAAATENPAASISFQNQDLMFPVPESDVSYTITYYEGRTDGILLSSDGRFKITEGRVPTTNDPNEFILYSAVIPPYPSLPKNLSLEMKEIIDTRVVNISGKGTRQERFTINSERVDTQIQGFTMSDISQLQRRIEALEYYNNLSLLDDSVRELSIPSSLDQSLERFKFGFFVDNFSDYGFSNVRDPAYNAGIYEFVLQPAKDTFNLPMMPSSASSNVMGNSFIHYPAEKTKLLSQQNATTGPRPKVVRPPRPVVRQKEYWLPSRNNRSRRGADLTRGNMVYEKFQVTLPSTSTGQLIVDFNAHSGIDRIEIYQSFPGGIPFLDKEIRQQNGSSLLPHNTTLNRYLGDHNSLMTVMPAARRRELRGKRDHHPFPGGNLVQIANVLNLTTAEMDGIIRGDFWTEHPNFITKNHPNHEVVEPGGFWLEYVGRIAINHNAAFGNIYTVVVIKGTPWFSMYISAPHQDTALSHDTPPASTRCVPGPVTKTLKEGRGDVQVFTYSNGCTEWEEEERIIPPRRPPVVCPGPWKPPTPVVISCGGFTKPKEEKPVKPPQKRPKPGGQELQPIGPVSWFDPSAGTTAKILPITLPGDTK